jgi:hypothetical protein
LFRFGLKPVIERRLVHPAFTRRPHREVGAAKVIQRAQYNLGSNSVIHSLKRIPAKACPGAGMRLADQLVKLSKRIDKFSLTKQCFSCSSEVFRLKAENLQARYDIKFGIFFFPFRRMRGGQCNSR